VRHACARNTGAMHASSMVPRHCSCCCTCPAR
jgi:hypothetical protein